ncbi:MAG: capsular polysaccharide biosynthesis protein [Paracoccaceae bacterium]|nr:capsular polysaccharide biosynthesis protein [Paracoccaceae bacterium]MDP7186546.1 capsular polysaccharide biosynthesis protein [Paracoccaceae bacterium]
MVPAPEAHDDTNAGGTSPRRLYVYNGGFLTSGRIRRILDLAGFEVKLGKPSAGDLIGVWGKSPTAPRGEAMADHTGQPILRVEDAFLRSLHPGRDGEPPIGLMLDESGVHFDAAQPSDLEKLLASHPFDDAPLLARAREGIARLKEDHLTKYAGVDPSPDLPPPGYVLVIDQTRGDASIRFGGANEASFHEMLYFAQTEHPAARIILKTHPETAAGHRAGHFSDADCNERISLMDKSVSPWALLEGAIAVYVVSSQMGFEAILAGHKPVVFGQPFYAGWGLSDDRNPVGRRQRVLTRAQLFAGAMLLYPTWYDPCRDRLCSFEEALEQIAAQARAWREDRPGWRAGNIRLWKRRHFQQFFGQQKPVIFSGKSDRPQMRWGRPDDPAEGVSIVEDGFLRSRGLGADLVPPLSLVLDDQGIYFDPTRESRLEGLIAKRAELRFGQSLRVERLIRSLTRGGISKYNLSGDLPDLPAGRRILVPGQVEDDASVQYGCGEIRTNLALLQETRRKNPDAVIIYKPHPDVEAGLRSGKIETGRLADVVAENADISALLPEMDEVWTLTSLTGFEALLRGVAVTCLGAPFYAGWGLTNDLGPVPRRRRARPALEGLVHAALIDYPRYRDPVSGLPCPVEVVVARLASGDALPRSPGLRGLAKVQGALASFAYLWR